MTTLSKKQLHNCIFQLYLERHIHSLYTTKVFNKVVEKNIDPKLLKKVGGNHKFTLVKDVPDYLGFEHDPVSTHKYILVPQYEGYLVNLTKYATIDDFLKSQLSKRNIKNLYSKKRKLESLGGVEYKILTGPLEKSFYSEVFTIFYTLLKKRFDKKKVFNRNLYEWTHLFEKTYPSLVAGTALLFVIYKDGEPICITLDYLLGNSVFSHIQTYDLTYSDYNLGDLNMLFQLKWCLANKMAILDISKGKNPYKVKWCNHEYRFHHEIAYKGDSLTMFLKAKMFSIKFSLIQKLREFGFLGNVLNMDKLLYIRYKNDLVGPQRTI